MAGGSRTAITGEGDRRAEIGGARRRKVGRDNRREVALRDDSVCARALAKVHDAGIIGGCKGRGRRGRERQVGGRMPKDEEI